MEYITEHYRKQLMYQEIVNCKKIIIQVYYGIICFCKRVKALVRKLLAIPEINNKFQ